jgi:hypothetical protein
MPKFDAAKLAEALEFDFRGAGVDAHGTIPEPSDKLIGAYLDEVVAAFSKIKETSGIADVSPEDPAAMLAALDKVDSEQFLKVLDEVSVAAAKLCGGTPSLTQIRKLPLRVRQHFFAYLQREIVNPEAGPGAGTPGQPTPLRAVSG